MAANPRRVKIYLAEKGLKDIEQVDFLPPFNELRSPAFLAKNPAGRIPVLELDDGTWLPESDAIIEYLEELYPEPPMLGTTPLERAWVRAFSLPFPIRPLKDRSSSWTAPLSCFE